MLKKASFISLYTGIDGNKNINGRKRNIIVDTLGLTLANYVCAANFHDGQAGIELLTILENTSIKMKLIRGDKAFRGDFTQSAIWCNYEVEISQKLPTENGFVPLTDRWQVERSLAWCNSLRRLAKILKKQWNLLSVFFNSPLFLSF